MNQPDIHSSIDAAASLMQTGRQRNFMKVAGAFSAIIVMLIALGSLWLWWQHDVALAEKMPELYAMQPNLAFMVLLLAGGLLMHIFQPRQKIVWFIGAAVGLVALTNVLDYVFGIPLRFDDTLLDDWASAGTEFPGRMAPNTALALLCSSICLVLSFHEWEDKASRMRATWIDGLAFIIFGMGATTILGKLGGNDFASNWGATNYMSYQSAISFILFGLGYLSLGWQRGSGYVSYGPIWTAALFSLIILLVDVVTPSTVSIGVVYLPIVFCSLWFSRASSAYFFAAVATALSLIGHLSTPPSEMIPYISWINRSISILVIWFVAVLVYLLRRHDTLLNESDLKLRAAVNYAVDGVITMNARGIVESYNPACERMFGYSPHEVIGQNISMLMPEPYHSEHDDYLARYLNTGKAKIIGTKGRRVRAKRKDDSVFPMDLTVSKFELPDGPHFCGIIRDISLEIEAEKTQDQLRQAQKMESLGQLTGGLAHDFNNLLAVILGNLDFLVEKTKKDDPLRKYIQPCIDASLHGSELTQRLLAFSRKQPLNPMTIDVNALINYFIRFVQRLLGERIEVLQKLQNDLWYVHVDAHQLQDALLNLAVNARDAMEDGGKLIIETKNEILDSDYTRHHSEVSEGEYVLISVSDTGSGMSAAALEKAFEPFFTTKAVGKGSGLGLSMVYGFVKQSKGHIKLYSEVGHGTTIKIYLPRADGTPINLMEDDENAQIEMVKSDLRVLLVEDNKELLKVTRTMLECMGYEVITAETGDAAYEIFESGETVDLLLTDVMLPGVLNGSTLAKAARKLYPDLKVIFISGFAEHAMSQSGLLEDGIPLLSKPFRKPQLADAINTMMKKPSSKH